MIGFECVTEIFVDSNGFGLGSSIPARAKYDCSHSYPGNCSSGGLEFLQVN